MQQSWKSPRQISACRSALNLYGLAGRHELERIAHRFADDLERLGADQDQIALGDRCRLRAPDIDTDGRQHGAAFTELRHSVGRLADDTDGDASANAARLPQRVLADIGIGEERIDGRSKERPSRIIRPERGIEPNAAGGLPAPPATAAAAPPIRRLAVATVVQRLLVSSQ